MRWLIALISNTGMRLAEAAGLHINDIKLEKDIPYVDIKPHPWRSLKTRGSQRQVPLVGASLWAAQRINANASSCFAFPRYTDHTRCNANSASNALNKWLHANFRTDIVIHGFRHAMRDRLRAVSCPSEMIDQIGGWSKTSVGEGYGEGFRLTQVFQALLSLSLKAKPISQLRTNGLECLYCVEVVLRSGIFPSKQIIQKLAG